MKVRALELGYYGDKRRREGDVFVLRPYKKYEQDEHGRLKVDKDNRPVFKVIEAEKQFSARWMQKVEDSVPETAPRSNRKFDKTTVNPDSLAAGLEAAAPISEPEPSFDPEPEPESKSESDDSSSDVI